MQIFTFKHNILDQIDFPAIGLMQQQWKGALKIPEVLRKTGETGFIGYPSWGSFPRRNNLCRVPTHLFFLILHRQWHGYKHTWSPWPTSLLVCASHCWNALTRGTWSVLLWVMFKSVTENSFVTTSIRQVLHLGARVTEMWELSFIIQNNYGCYFGFIR